MQIGNYDAFPVLRMAKFTRGDKKIPINELYDVFMNFTHFDEQGVE